jgi:glutamate/tyrosine decarboxylase-like PLP-dependent enzyme
VLARAGWAVEERGLREAPPIRVVIGEQAHVTILSSLRMLGLGSGPAIRVRVDDQGRMDAGALEHALAAGAGGPTIVCAQAGNVSTGAFDPFPAIASVCREHAAWLHVDGAFGLWAAACPSRRGLLRGAENADSWATDAHKWLNVPYDCGLVFVADLSAHRAAMGAHADYLVRSQDERDPQDWVPESSRRARGFAVYAALRSLGRRGVRELVERCCRLATTMAARLGQQPGVRILNEVVLNQVLVGLDPPPGTDPEAFTRAVIGRVQRAGVCWLAGTRWRGLPALRISVCNWSTTEKDIERSAESIVRSIEAERSTSRSRSDAETR